ncbi:MAG: hypothetical protein ACKODX_05825, partial [Gemmata sp.]
KLERKGEKLTWPEKVTPDTGELPALAAALGAGDGAEPPPEPRPLLKRPAVVIPLFLATLAALVLPFARPAPSAEELYAAAEPLVKSDRPADWDAAAGPLERLARTHPDQYKDEVARARRTLKDRQELRRALAGAKGEGRSEAERAYLRGLRLAQDGEREQARTAWEGVVAAFAAAPDEERWVDLARTGLKLLAQPP